MLQLLVRCSIPDKFSSQLGRGKPWCHNCDIVRWKSCSRIKMTPQALVAANTQQCELVLPAVELDIVVRHVGPWSQIRRPLNAVIEAGP